MKYPDVTRVTVVGPGGREIEAWGCVNVSVEIEDDARTLKLFYQTVDTAPEIDMTEWRLPRRDPLTDTDEGVK